jgi:hypothetical protein
LQDDLALIIDGTSLFPFHQFTNQSYTSLDPEAPQLINVQKSSHKLRLPRGAVFVFLFSFFKVSPSNDHLLTIMSRKVAKQLPKFEVGE